MIPDYQSISDTQKLHHILEFVCKAKKEKNKGSCDTDEIASSFNPPLKVAEVNVLCRILMANGDVKDCSSQGNIDTLCILFIRQTLEAFETEKYLTDMDKMPYNFNVYFETMNDRFYIFNLDKSKIQKVIDAYINGSKSFFIYGEKYLIEGLQKIKIYTYESSISEKKFISNCINEGGLSYPEPYTDRIILYPQAFLKIGTDVTDKFIGDNEYGGSSIKELNKNESFVNESLINELRRVKSKDFDLTRLIQLCKEINDNYRNEDYFSVGMLGRTILQHVPPIFNCRSFDEVVNNYAKKSFKRNMEHLSNTIDIADTMLHQQIRKVETLPNAQQVNFIQSLDVLLQEIIRVMKL